MKKIVYLFLIFFCVSSCADVNTPDVPSNDENPTEDNNSTGGNNNQGETVVNPKYLKQMEYYYSYQDESFAIDTNVYKIVYDRGTDVKYLKSINSYVNNNLSEVKTYQNINNADYGTYTFVLYNQSMVGTGADTTYWYDEDRTLPKKTINNGSVSIYEYNEEGFEKSIEQLINNQLFYRITYTYMGNYRYGLQEIYDISTGEMHGIGYDTLVYENKDKKHIKKRTYYTKTENDICVSTTYLNEDYINCEYGINHITRNLTSKIELRQNGEVTTNTQKDISNYAYQDELHYTIEHKNYSNGKLLTNLIYKYTMVR